MKSKNQGNKFLLMVNNVCLHPIAHSRKREELHSVGQVSRLDGRSSTVRKMSPISDRFAELQPQTNELRSLLTGVYSVAGQEVSIT